MGGHQREGLGARAGCATLVLGVVIGTALGAWAPPARAGEPAGAEPVAPILADPPASAPPDGRASIAVGVAMGLTPGPVTSASDPAPGTGSPGTGRDVVIDDFDPPAAPEKGAPPPEIPPPAGGQVAPPPPGSLAPEVPMIAPPPEGWTALASPGARLRLSREESPRGGSLRLDFDLGQGGWVIARRAVSLQLPDNYVFSFQMRGHAPSEELQLKLVDPAGANVWWWKRRDAEFSESWQRVLVRKPRIQFAWGPAGGGEPTQVGALEIAIAAGSGGSGTVWIDDLRLEEREPPSLQPRKAEASASSATPDHPPAGVTDLDPYTAWHSDPADPAPWLLLDYGRLREFGGLVIDWDPLDYATAYRVELSPDGRQWETVYRAQTAYGGRDWIYLPDQEARAVRILPERSSRGRGYGVVFAGVVPLELAASPNRFLERIAGEAPRGYYPRYLLKEGAPWAVVGADGDDSEGLLSLDGQLEVDREAFSIEPFLWVDGRLYSWASVHTEPALMDGSLPIPSVAWRAGELVLHITAFAPGPPGSSLLVARYRLENTGAAPRRATLFLAVRPFQVLPPWQNLGLEGGVAPIHRLSFVNGVASVGRDRVVVPLVTPDDAGAARSEEGPVARFLVQGRVPPRKEVEDPLGFVSGAMAWDLEVGPGQHDEVSVAVPFHAASPRPTPSRDRARAAAWVDRQLDETEASWRERLGRFTIALPPSQAALEESVRASLGWILVNRDGPRIQPGSRTYERTWIRDGAFTAGALLELGYADEARAFLRWYAPFQFENGRIPCCVDHRGADPTPENDSEGEFIWGVAETWRHTQDTAFAAEMWPHVVRAAEAIDRLRHERLGPQMETPEQRLFTGLLPESISHEGYSGHPVHSYWDDFMALRGLKDAAALAVVLGDEARAERYSGWRDAFRRDLLRSIEGSIAAHQLDYVPASVELHDFDPNSTAIAVEPVGEAESLPEPALRDTFERWWHEFETRWNGPQDWNAYTAYELRNASPLLLLGWPERARTVLQALVADQRPPAWHQWPEISWRDPRAPRFLGDLPHGWIASTYLRAMRRLFVYERDADGVLVLAAGVPESWVDESPGVRVAGLSTHQGTLGYTLRGEPDGGVVMELDGDLALGPAGLEVVSPRERPLRAVTVNGEPVEGFEPRRVVVHQVPARIELSY